MHLQKKSIRIWIVFTEGGFGFELYLHEKLNEVYGFGFYLRMIHVFGFGFASRGFVPTFGYNVFPASLIWYPV